MPFSRCPGSAGITRPKPEEKKCPGCGRDVEIWTDESSAACRSCGCRVSRRGGIASCLDWCRHAKECAGDEAYRKYIQEKGKQETA